MAMISSCRRSWRWVREAKPVEVLWQGMKEEKKRKESRAKERKQPKVNNKNRIGKGFTGTMIATDGLSMFVLDAGSCL